jgi:hypothetical protein
MQIYNWIQKSCMKQPAIYTEQCGETPPEPVGFDHLSSIDSDDNNDDNVDAGEELQALSGGGMDTS